MATFPDSPRAAFMQWCQTHAPIFVANAAAIGLTPAQAAVFAAATNDAADDVLAQDAAQEAARVATQRASGSTRALQTLAGDLVRVIRAFAGTQSPPDAIYNAAQIPPPAQPSPAPPPGSPTAFRIELLQTGPLKLAWKCPNPRGIGGTTYEILRRIDGGEFVYVGTTGTRTFLDETLPAGSRSATYQVTAVRSTVRGAAAQFTVNFGIDGAAFAIASAATAGHRGISEATPSTANGQVVQKVLRNTNGNLTQRR